MRNKTMLEEKRFKMDPFLGAVFQKSLDKLVDSISTRIDFIRNYRSNFKKLEEELGELDRRELEVKLLVEAAENKGEEIEKHIEEWQKAATDMIKKVKELVETNEKAEMKCCMNLCPDLIKRYKLSNNAIKKADEVSGFRAKDLAPISHPRILQGKNYLTTEFIDNCESRNITLNNVISALVDHVNMVGIFGMGGVGKTTLAKKVGQMVKGQQLFDFVVFAEVKQQPDLEEIQNSIAGMLNLNLQKQGVPARAGELYEMLEKKKKVLIILDNIWNPIDLKEVGIPFADGDKGCQLLLTTRDTSVLTEMGCEKQFSIDAFDKEDSWKLLAEIAGSCVQRDDIKSIAKDVVDRCGGLPVAIVTMAKALKDKPVNVWEAALQEFQRYSKSTVMEKAHSSIKLSYKHLNPDGLKPIFWLCCILSSFSEPSVENLLRYGLSLNIFEPIKSMEDQWNSACKAIHELMDCSLLLELSEDGIFAIHDVVREVGTQTRVISPAVECLIVNEVLRPSIQRSLLGNLTWLFLIDLDNLPNKLNGPNLTFLYLKTKSGVHMPPNFFSEMSKLEVIHLEGLDLTKLPKALDSLVELGALFVKKCKLQDISRISEFKNLEILVILDSPPDFDIFEDEKMILPKSIGKLSWLRLLDLRGSPFNISPEIISRLTLLEELYIDDWKRDWWIITIRSIFTSTVASLEELKKLHRLTALEVSVSDEYANFEVLSESEILQNLKRYRLSIGEKWSHGHFDKSSRTLHIRSRADICFEGVIKKLNGIENLSLCGEHIIKTKTLSEKVFPSLKNLYLEDLVNLEKVCQDEVRPHLPWFCQLRRIQICRCNNLKNLFPLSIVNQLLVLELIEVRDCKNISEIFTGDVDRGAENGAIDSLSFKKLDILHLENLPKLTRICSEMEVTLSASVNQEKIEFSNLTNLQLWSVDVKRILPSLLQKNIRKMEISFCNNLKYIFSSTTLSRVKNLRELSIRSCKNLQVLVRIDDDSESARIGFLSLESLVIRDCDTLRGLIGRMEEIVKGTPKKFLLPQLTSLSLHGLPQLTHFYRCHEYSVEEWPKLKTLKVIRCHQKLDLFDFQNHPSSSSHSSSIQHQGFPLLEDLTLNPKQFEMISWSSFAECRQFFPRLRCLHIQTTYDFVTYKDPEFLGDDVLGKFHFLEKLRAANCSNEEMFTSGEVEKEANVFWLLKELQVSRCDKLNILLPPQSFPFKNLKILKVSYCSEMVSVISISMVESLMMLEDMSITYCEKVVEIIGNVEDSKIDEITWSKLKSLEIDHLDNLMNFYSGNCIFNFPLLEKIKVYYCPKIMFFSSGAFTMPKLEQVEKNGMPHHCKDQDLNKLICQTQ